MTELTHVAASRLICAGRHLCIHPLGRQPAERSGRASTSCGQSARVHPFSTVPRVRPGGESPLHLSGWQKVEKVLQVIDAIEALGIDPADAAPDHWVMFTTACGSANGRDRTARAGTRLG